MSVKFHFLNVGAGDCTIVHFPERTTTDAQGNKRTKSERIMMVDIYHREDHDEFANIIEYYKENFTDGNGKVKSIFRFVCTHPHQDHICGISELFENSGITIHNFWDTENDFEPEEFDNSSSHAEDWRTYTEKRKSETSPKVHHFKRESSPQQYWNDDEDRISVLSPSNELIKRAHYNAEEQKRENHQIEIDEMSYALLIRVNKRKIILGGDGRADPVWEDIYTNCKDDIKDTVILKAPHHGHLSGFHEKAAELMNPALIVFSNSEEEDTENGAEKEYQKAVPRATILKTCVNGTIIVSVPFDGTKTIEYETEF